MMAVGGVVVVRDGADDEGGMKRHTGRQIQQQGLVDDERRGKTVQNRLRQCVLSSLGPFRTPRAFGL